MQCLAMSNEQMIDERDPSRRQEFLEAFKEFPGGSSSEADAALELRPFVAQLARNSSNYGVKPGEERGGIPLGIARKGTFLSSLDMGSHVY